MEMEEEQVSAMETKQHENGIIEIISDEILIRQPGDFSEIFPEMFVQYECSAVILKKENIAPEFFDLSTGFAGELLQKFSNWKKRLGVIGDFTAVKSKALRDFIYESNTTKQIIFAKTVDDGLKIFAPAL
jgi:hypothetical protein